MARRIRDGVSINIEPLKKFGRIVTAGVDGRSGPFHAMFIQWGVRYFAFLRTRYRRFSRGGGDWPKLKPATIKARRGGGRVSILFDTGTIFRALQPGMPGNLFVRTKRGVRCGFGGGGRHPGGRQISQIAEFHNAGKGNLPRRQIIVEPDRKTTAGFIKDLRRAIVKAGKEAE